MTTNLSTAELVTDAALSRLEGQNGRLTSLDTSRRQLAPDRYIELDSLRGLAALTVVVGHFIGVYQNSPWFAVWNASPFRFIGAGHEAVVLFFLLSGFVLAVPYSKPNR